MSKKPGGSLWGVGTAAIYVGFVLFVLSLVMYASFQDFQLVEAGYYERGLDYQATIDRRQRSQDAEHRLTIEHRPAEAQIVVSLARPDAPETVGIIRMMRPSNARLDRQWPLEIPLH